MLRKISKLVKGKPAVTTKTISKLPSGIYSVNYHRIGDRDTTPFDSNVFSCSTESFDHQLQFFKSHFHVISCTEAASIIESGQPMTERYLVITFDDGYIDNYTNAFPLLTKHGLSAVFFIPTSFVGNEMPVPWWDQIAYLVKHSDHKLLRDDIRFGNCYNKCKDKTIKALLRFVKTDSDNDLETSVAVLSKTLGFDSLPKDIISSELFMSWDMLKEMSLSGMDIGSHTCSHNVLTHLSDKEQDLELTLSKRELESHLDKSVEAFAYPVGAYHTFNINTAYAVKRAGYRIAFNFEKGINRQKDLDPYSLFRYPVNYEHSPRDIVRMFNTGK